MSKLFGTDGIRGLANIELTPELAFRLGRASGYVLSKHDRPLKVLVGKDTRLSGDMLEAALMAGFMSVGACVYLAGVIPTPAIAFLVKQGRFDIGVMISASHNPMQDNGIKFFNSDGYKLPDAQESAIEDIIANYENNKLPAPIGRNIGTVKRLRTASSDYITFLKTAVNGNTLQGIKIAIDCANGAASYVAHDIFTQFGAEVTTIYNNPDGCNINADCGSTHMDNLCKFVINNKMDAGLAFDGDCDRMLAVDHLGNIIDGDVILAILGQELANKGKLAKDTIVATTLSNKGLEIFCKNHGLKLVRTDVGDKYVLESIIKNDYSLGGEQSGHIIVKEFSTTGDGLLSGLLLLCAAVKQGKNLHELSKMIELLPQIMINVKVPNNRKSELNTNNIIQSKLNEIVDTLADNGRVLLRPSGTEPLVRVMLEGRDKEHIGLLANELADVIRNNLG